MSATGRAFGRSALDQYPTPPWCVQRLLEVVPLVGRGNRFLEPAAGDGAIIRAVTGHGNKKWTAFEIDPRFNAELVATGVEVTRRRQDTVDVVMADFLRAVRCASISQHFDFGITNPPYGLTAEFVGAMRQCCRSFALLLPMNYLGTKGRAATFRRDMPDVGVLPDRPSFVVKITRRRDGTLRGTTSDNREYGWFIWPEQPRPRGELFMLADTPAADIKAAKALRPRIEVDE